MVERSPAYWRGQGVLGISRVEDITLSVDFVDGPCRGRVADGSGWVNVILADQPGRAPRLVYCTPGINSYICAQVINLGGIPNVRAGF